MLQKQLTHSYSDTSLGLRRNVIYKNDGIKWRKFEDGFPNLFIEDVKNVTGRDGELLSCIDFCRYIFWIALAWNVCCILVSVADVHDVIYDTKR